MQNKIVDAALRALLYEVTLNPKPGLVDPVTTGAHRDMDVFTFIDSTVSLRTYFEQVVDCARDFSGDDLQDLFAQIRPLGIVAEREMFLATHGVNTHKGAIFSLGILVAAASFVSKSDSVIFGSASNVDARYGTKAPSRNRTADGMVETVKKMLSALTENDFQNLADKKVLTTGEKQFLQYGIRGIRGEAEAGFPTVFELALPYLQANTAPLKERLLDTLMFISSHLADSNLIKRAGNIDILDEMKVQAEKYFQSSDKIDFLKKLDQDFTKRNLSLGGAADMLILTIFMALILGDL